MRLSLHGANPAEWLALRAGVVPNAAAEAWGGMALSGVLIAAVRTGVTARLAEHPSTAEDLAARPDATGSAGRGGAGCTPIPGCRSHGSWRAPPTTGAGGQDWTR